MESNKSLVKIQAADVLTSDKSENLNLEASLQQYYFEDEQVTGGIRLIHGFTCMQQ